MNIQNGFFLERKAENLLSHRECLILHFGWSLCGTRGVAGGGQNFYIRCDWVRPVFHGGVPADFLGMCSGDHQLCRVCGNSDAEPAHPGPVHDDRASDHNPDDFRRGSSSLF